MKPTENTLHTQKQIPEPAGDGFPPEQDISSPPPESDEADGDEPSRATSAKED